VPVYCNISTAGECACPANVKLLLAHGCDFNTRKERKLVKCSGVQRMSVHGGDSLKLGASL